MSTDFFRRRTNSNSGADAGKTTHAAPPASERRLEAVKVVRNDLSDADLEVVPIKPEEKSERAAPRRSRLLKSELAGMAWTRLTARWFNSQSARA